MMQLTDVTSYSMEMPALEILVHLVPVFYKIEAPYHNGVNEAMS
jgi:hypothetical protein